MISLPDYLSLFEKRSPIRFSKFLFLPHPTRTLPFFTPFLSSEHHRSIAYKRLDRCRKRCPLRISYVITLDCKPIRSVFALTLQKILLDAILCIVAFKRVVWSGSLTDEMLATLSTHALRVVVLSMSLNHKETR